MSDSTKDHPIDQVERHARTLKAALGEVREEHADIADAAYEMRVAERARLEELLEELDPLIADIDPSDDRFDFAISRGERMRLWIDMTSFVAMDQDANTFRFLKDTRLGRMVLGESDDVEVMGDAVSRYIAEKIIERERTIEGEWIETKQRALASADPEIVQTSSMATSTTTNSLSESRTSAASSLKSARAKTAPDPANKSANGSNRVANEPGGFWKNLLSFLSGIALTIAAALAAAWAFLPDLFAQMMSALGLS